jgi:hypothetical protein
LQRVFTFDVETPTGSHAMNDPFAAREPMAAPPPAVRHTPADYEFSPTQERTIASLARLMQIIGGASMLFGVLALLALFGSRSNALVVIIQSALMITIGALTLKVGGSFDRIRASIGSDIKHLMTALQGLRTIYLVQAWVLGLALLFLVLVLGWAMIVAMGR